MKIFCTFLTAAGLLAVLCGTASADPEDTRLTDFLDLGSLVQGIPHPVKSADGLVLCLQDDGWGWGEDEEEEEEEEPEEGAAPEGEGPGSGGDWGWGEGGKKKEEDKGWGWDEGKKEAEKPAEDEEWGEGGWEEGEEPPIPGRDIEDMEDRGPSVAWAKKTRIGLAFGGFLPFGAKEEAYGVGGMGGPFLGFALPPLLGNLTVTDELRLLIGQTSSMEQETGYDVTTLMIFVKNDLLFHFMPNSKGFNLYFFLGVGFALEMSSATKENTATGETEDDSGTFPGFIVDTGFGSWVNIGGPVDLILKLEFNLVPVTKNVPFFAVGEVGIQIKI
ncbi:MAG: hypothetical protein ACYTHM_06025 [Planctomycetota bacterium]|jgi:hypothetical protein